MSVKVFVEGGGDRNKSLQTECRKGFSDFFAKAGLKGRMPRVVACGARRRAFDNYRTALKQGEQSILLVDSELHVSAAPWEHVRGVDNWQRPDGALDDQLQFMVVTMEAWFYADKEALEAYYGSCFRRNALSGRSEIEDISKADLFSGLSGATAQCPDGEYSKGSDSFKILSKLDPNKVRNSSNHARRLLEVLQRVCHA